MRHLESRLQSSCLRWFRLQYPGILIFAIPNGGKRSAREATILKSEGVTAGVADLFIMRSAGLYHGLFIEMKQGKGRQSPAQIDFQCRCIMEFYKYEVCSDVDSFIKVVNQYLK